MIISIDTDDARDVRALEIAATAESWERLPGGAYRIPSQDGRRVYVVTPESCSCEDARAHRCKHRRGLAIYLALREAADPKPQPSRFAKMSEAELFGRL